MQHVGPSSLTRDQTWSPCVGSTESYPLGHQGSLWSQDFEKSQDKVGFTRFSTAGHHSALNITHVNSVLHCGVSQIYPTMVRSLHGLKAHFGKCYPRSFLKIFKNTSYSWIQQASLYLGICGVCGSGCPEVVDKIEYALEGLCMNQRED